MKFKIYSMTILVFFYDLGVKTPASAIFLCLRLHFNSRVVRYQMGQNKHWLVLTIETIRISRILSRYTLWLTWSHEKQECYCGQYFWQSKVYKTNAAMTENLEVNWARLKGPSYLRASHFENHIMMKDFSLHEYEWHLLFFHISLDKCPKQFETSHRLAILNGHVKTSKWSRRMGQRSPLFYAA